MKRKTKKLALSKETVRDLDTNLKVVVGGVESITRICSECTVICSICCP